MSKDDIIKNLLDIKNIFEKNNIQNLYLTGSFSRGDFNSKSDVDLIYSVKKGKKFSLFNVGSLKFNLEKKIGKMVDLVDESGIKPELKKYLEKDKILIF